MKTCSKCLATKQETEFYTNGPGRLRADCRPCFRKRMNGWRQTHPKELATMQRRTHIKRLYGMTTDEYELLLAWQGGVCAVCGRTQSKSYHIDHAHDTGAIRGILCSRCNWRMNILDDAKWLVKARQYHRHPPATMMVHDYQSGQGYTDRV